MVPALSLANMLLTVLIFVAWMTRPTCASPDGHYLDFPESPFDSRPQTENTLNFAKEVMTFMKEVLDEKKETAASLFKELSKFTSVVPIIGPAFAGINMLMVFIPQYDPVLQAVKDGFTEVNRKLDSLSMQLFDLATDVEWFNYASVYSQDEVRILGAWKKYEEFFKDGNSTDFNYLAFVNNYEYTQVQASVFNLYHYLTVKDTSLSGNLNDLLRDKFKCDLKKILRYNIYFSSLLIKGIALNNFYWNMLGYESTEKEPEHIHMFKKVFAAQKETVDFCLKSHMEYAKVDVVTVANSVGNNNMQAITDKVKGFLDNKYDFYKWVVLVYEKSRETDEYIIVDDNTMTKIPINNDLIVAIAYMQKADIPKDQLIDNPSCPSTSCGDCVNSIEMKNGKLLKYWKTTHTIYDNDFAESPSSNVTLDCIIDAYYDYKLNVHYSWTGSPCEGPDMKCQNNGRCKRLLDSNDAVCECEDGFYGEMCEKKIDTDLLPDFVKRPLSIVKTANVRLAKVESKLDKILEYFQLEHCTSPAFRGL